MPLRVYRLRRILAATAVLLILVVAGMYFYARSRATNVLNSIPGKIGFDIKQTAHGFQFSKSDGKRTLFTVQASDIKEFKLNGNADYKDYHEMAKHLPADKIAKWLQDPNTPAFRYGLYASMLGHCGTEKHGDWRCAVVPSDHVAENIGGW